MEWYKISPAIPSSDFSYRYKTLSVSHLKELQEDIDRLKREGRLSNNDTYRNYVGSMKFEIPENLRDARSLIVMAIPTKLMLVNFHLDCRAYEVMVPPQYYSTGLTAESLRNYVMKTIVKDPKCRLEETGAHLKTLAVRSGLGRYGRNNLCYVEGMGSLLKLVAYFTNYEFTEDSWTEPKMMEKCEKCNICVNLCPTKCINKERFVINVGSCITLYNEVKGEFPEWIPPDAHNALIGCMRCQLTCPANHEVIKQTGRLEDVTGEETKKILAGTPDEELLSALPRKLKNFVPSTSKEHFPIFTRNLKALLPYD
ncbi:hypothetical protein KAI12_04055 [Candidatus Bathyarchaeota archaeon]|nr:hypothetical protein [Candidatus Bathyarchaeota archaeon]